MSVSVTPRGLTPAALVRVTFARRRNCDFCDAQTHTHHERRASARRGIGKRTRTGASATARRTADRRVGERRCNNVAAATGSLRPRSRSLMCVCAAQKLLFRRRTNAIHKSGGRQPAVRLPIVWPARLRAYSDTLVPRSARSGGREPAVRLPIVWPARLRTYSETLVPRSVRSGGCQPAVADGQRTCKGATATVRKTVVGALAHAIAIALP